MKYIPEPGIFFTRSGCFLLGWSIIAFFRSILEGLVTLTLGLILICIAILKRVKEVKQYENEIRVRKQ